MTREQYDRWKDFALRMARTCFTTHRRPSPQWIIDRVADWFRWRDYQEDWENYSSWDQDEYPLCDHITVFFDNYRPSSGRCKVCEHECCESWPNYQPEGSCSFCKLDCTCHEREDLCDSQFDDQWLGPVRCCLRAGIDMICEPSAGVIGFTAGDIRRMYPEGVPDWLFPPDEHLYYWLTDEVNGTFAELADTASVVL